MLTAKKLQKLKNQMEDLSSALFYNYSTAVLKFPVCLISLQKLDDVGNLWFIAPKPHQYIDTFDKEFPSTLHFYKKGKNFHIKTHGKAMIINDPDQINLLDAEIRAALNDDKVLIKMRVQKVECFEEFDQTNLIRSFKNFISKWIFREEPGYQPYWFGNSDVAAF